MDAFKKVDSNNLRPVYRSEGQSDWQNWKQGEGKEAAGAKKSSQYKRSGHAHVFPKLGKSTGPEDRSNLDVGNHDEVLIPEHVAKKRHRHWRDTMAEREAEKAKLAKQQHHTVQTNVAHVKDNTIRSDDGNQLLSQSNQNTTVEKVVLPEGWHEMTEPGSNKLYYFNTSTGETSDTVPTATPTTENTIQANTTGPTFIASATFTKPKQGYVFKSGAQGVGYYVDNPSHKASQSNTTTLQEDPLIGTTYQPLEKLEPRKVPKRNARIERKQRATYASNFMDVVANSLSQYAEKQNPVHHGAGGLAAAQQNTPQQTRTIPPPRPPPVMWQTLRDPLSRRKYYYNPVTKERTWDKPPGV